MQPDGAGRIRIVLIDDHALLREVVFETLNVEPDMVVIGVAASGPAGIAHCEIEQPDVVLLDGNIPHESVTETVHSVRSASPKARILIVSMPDDPALVRQLLDCGVRGYLNKSASRNDLVSSIRAVCADNIRIVLHVSVEALAHIATTANCEDRLTRREMEILILVSKAMSNRQISRRLTIAEGTVKRHLGTIFTKLGARSRLEAVNKAVSRGLIARAG
ncbi:MULTISPECIES: response regulator transcription factor [unclassified Streptomyces]|uniref:response regulator n=1 Tax=unclassified Streptomyces TaxID=2593676 RepID=UPI00278BE24E|nr:MULTISPECIES: response regulator transcription factor [unclassified Streptomyces]